MERSLSIFKRCCELYNKVRRDRKINISEKYDSEKKRINKGLEKWKSKRYSFEGEKKINC